MKQLRLRMLDLCSHAEERQLKQFLDRCLDLLIKASADVKGVKRKLALFLNLARSEQQDWSLMRDQFFIQEK